MLCALSLVLSVTGYSKHGQDLLFLAGDEASGLLEKSSVIAAGTLREQEGMCINLPE